jgi:hypothetical protein
MSTPKQLPDGPKTPPPLGPPPLTDTPTPTLHEGPHSPAAVNPPEEQTSSGVKGDRNNQP